MSKLQLKIKRLRDGAVMPRYMTVDAAGMDLCAVTDEPLILQPGERALVPTGLALAIPSGFEGQVRPRSGMALKQGVSVLNAPGTIDADYRGELGVILINHGQDVVTITTGDRIAQLVIAPVVQVETVWAESLDETQRNSGGFGHTGTNGESSDES
jgi:dUTP pyrophosphatase